MVDYTYKKNVSLPTSGTYYDHTMCVTQVASDTLSTDVDNCFAGAIGK